MFRAQLPDPAGLVYLTEALRTTLLPLCPELEPLDLFLPQELGEMLANFFYANRAKCLPNCLMNLYWVGSTDLADHLGFTTFESHLLDRVFRRLIIFTPHDQAKPSVQNRLVNCLMSSYNAAVKNVFPVRCQYFC